MKLKEYDLLLYKTSNTVRCASIRLIRHKKVMLGIKQYHQLSFVLEYVYDLMCFSVSKKILQ